MAPAPVQAPTRAPSRMAPASIGQRSEDPYTSEAMANVFEWLRSGDPRGAFEPPVPAPSLASRAVEFLPERFREPVRSAGRAFEESPAGSALRMVASRDPSELMADVAGGPLIRGGRRILPKSRNATGPTAFLDESAPTEVWKKVQQDAWENRRRLLEDLPEWDRLNVPQSSRVEFNEFISGAHGDLLRSRPFFTRAYNNNVPVPSPGLDMSEAARMRRADQMYPARVFHASSANDPETIISFNPVRGNKELKDIASLHAGTLAAAADRAKNIGDQGKRVSFFELRGNVDRPFLDSSRASSGGTMGSPWKEQDLSDWVSRQQPSLEDQAKSMRQLEETLNNIRSKRFFKPHEEAKLIQLYKYDVPRQIAARRKLIEEGYNVIPYINAVEDHGSISYMFLNPGRDLRLRDAAFDPAKRDSADLLAGIALPALFTGGAVANQRRKREDQ
jgi:hypothetical protein